MKTIVLVIFCTFTVAAATPKHPTARRNVKSASTKGKRQGKSKGTTAVSNQRTGQATPTPERYQEIQQALVAKGYLKSAPTGSWDTDSVEALRQFQAANQLDPTGKLTAASLIGLGLGPSTAGAAFSGIPAPSRLQNSNTPQIGPDDLPPQPESLPAPAVAPSSAPRPPAGPEA